MIKKERYKIAYVTSIDPSEMAYIKTQTPIIYSTDATFDAIHDYYTAFCNLARISLFEGNKIEQTILKKASAVICASKWTSDSIIQKYKIIPQKVFILPRGANLDTIPERKQALALNHNLCKLLFVGTDWKRKGGGIAQERQIYDKILRETAFLLLPTREECFGIIFAESCAYGIPSIATNTGGVSAAVVNEKTGYLLPIRSRGKEYAMLIKDLFIGREKYNKFRQSSRDYYEKHLNWDSCSQKLKIIIDEKILYH